MTATMTKTTMPHLLWVSFASEPAAEELIEYFADSFRITRTDDRCVASLAIHPQPDMICLQYDHPDALGLNLLLEIKARIPSTPITMLTRQHTEELAVWAFRAGVWDYLVLPMSTQECSRYLKASEEL